MSSIPDSFSIVMQEGIQGGFAPPIPDALYTITRQTQSQNITITTQTRPHGTPSLLPPQTKELVLADNSETISQILARIRDIPTQYPGANDIYGKGISIIYLAGEMAASEFRPYGSIAGQGIPNPTEEQKEKFDQAVKMIKKLVDAK